MAGARAWDQLLLDPFTTSVDKLLNVPANQVPGLDKITLAHLLSHCSGVNEAANPFNDLTIAKHFNTTEPNDWHLVEYLLNHPSPPPGGIFPTAPQMIGYNPPPATLPSSVYSGTGMSLAGQCIARAVGKTTFPEAMRDLVNDKLGVTRARVIKLTADEAAEDPAVCRFHDDPGYAPDYYRLEKVPVFNTIVAPHIAPWTYNGGGATGAAPGGWFMAAVDVARLFSSLDVPNNPLFDADQIEDLMLTRYSMAYGLGFSVFKVEGGGPLLPLLEPGTYAWHNGGWRGTSALAYRRGKVNGEGVSIVVMFNHGYFGMDSDEGGQLVKLADDYAKLAGWPSGDLFKAVDLPEY
jgi:CubicO group peptidase (beta-lactamase class C family)